MSEPVVPRHPAQDFSPASVGIADAWAALDRWRRVRAAYVADQASWPTGSAGFHAEDWSAESRIAFTAGG